MAVVVSMANAGREVHPFFMPKASESPPFQFTLVPESMSKVKFEQISDTLRREALVETSRIAKGRGPSPLVRSALS